MGLLDLAGKAIGGAVNFTASVAKEAYDASVEDKICRFSYKFNCANAIQLDGCCK